MNKNIIERLTTEKGLTYGPYDVIRGTYNGYSVIYRNLPNNSDAIIINGACHDGFAADSARSFCDAMKTKQTRRYHLAITLIMQ